MAKANVMIDNDKTRVTEWSFEVGDETGKHIHEYDYLIINDKFETAVSDLQAIIHAGRLLQKRQSAKLSKLILELSTAKIDDI